MTPVRLEPATLRSRVKHSTTEPQQVKSVLIEILEQLPYTVQSLLKALHKNLDLDITRAGGSKIAMEFYKDK